MKKIIAVLAMSLGAVAVAHAQVEGVTVSNDPAKAAAIERHAQELQSSHSMPAAHKHGMEHVKMHREHMAAKAKKS